MKIMQETDGVHWKHVRPSMGWVSYFLIFPRVKAGNLFAMLLFFESSTRCIK